MRDKPCDACIRAAINARTGRFNAGCSECAARALAHSPIFATAAQAQAMTRGYQDALMNHFGDDWRTGHVRVKFWADQIDEARKA